MKNIAYTREYREYAQSLDYIFETEPKYTRNRTLGNGEYFIDEYEYAIEKEGENGVLYHTGVSRLVIRNKQREAVLEVKALYDNQLVSLVKHRNGRDYIVYRKDLYGYSVFDVTEGKSADYIPRESFKGGGETFIWTQADYYPVNNLLVVSRCYWACPYGYEFYDFSNPLELPLRLYCDTCTLEQEQGFITDDMIPVKVRDDGMCVLAGEDEDGNKMEKTIDVLNYGRSKHKRFFAVYHGS